MLAKVHQKSKAIDRFRERIYEASDKVKQNISVYETMDIFDDYLEEISGRWLPKLDVRFVYAQCSECGETHDAASKYCPSCGRLMDSNDFNEYVRKVQREVDA